MQRDIFRCRIRDAEPRTGAYGCNSSLNEQCIRWRGGTAAGNVLRRRCGSGRRHGRRVEHRDHRPLVENRAGVRDSELQPAPTSTVVAAQPQISVLIVELGDVAFATPAASADPGRTTRRVGPSSAPPAPAPDATPPVPTRCSAGVGRRAAATSAVQAIVVGEVAPAAQDRAHRQVAGQRQSSATVSKYVLPPGGRRSPVGLEQRRPAAPPRRASRPSIRVTRATASGPMSWPTPPRSRRPRPAAVAGTRPPHGPPRRWWRSAASGAPARHAHLDAHVDRPDRARGGQRRRHQLDAAHRIHPAHQPEFGVGIQFGGQPAQPRIVDKLVGQHHVTSRRTPGTPAPG